MKKEGIGEHDLFDVDITDLDNERKRYRYEWNKSGLHEIARPETVWENEGELGKARKEMENAFEEGEKE